MTIAANTAYCKRSIPLQKDQTLFVVDSEWTQT